MIIETNYWVYLLALRYLLKTSYQPDLDVVLELSAVGKNRVVIKFVRHEAMGIRHITATVCDYFPDNPEASRTLLCDEIQAVNNYIEQADPHQQQVDYDRMLEQYLFNHFRY